MTFFQLKRCSKGPHLNLFILLQITSHCSLGIAGDNNAGVGPFGTGSSSNAVVGGAGGDGGDNNGNTANGGSGNSGDFSGNGGIAAGNNGNGGNGGTAIGGEWGSCVQIQIIRFEAC